MSPCRLASARPDCAHFPGLSIPRSQTSATGFRLRKGLNHRGKRITVRKVLSRYPSYLCHDFARFFSLFLPAHARRAFSSRSGVRTCTRQVCRSAADLLAFGDCSGRDISARFEIHDRRHLAHLLEQPRRNGKTNDLSTSPFPTDFRRAL